MLNTVRFRNVSGKEPCQDEFDNCDYCREARITKCTLEKGVHVHLCEVCFYFAKDLIVNQINKLWTH